MLVNVCACFDVMISHGWPAAKLPRRRSFFLSFGTQLSFFFFFFFFTMLLALSVFLLRRTKVELKKL